MNNVILIGRLTKDCDLRYTQGGKAVATFTLAIDKFSNGEKAADFINCVVWEKTAEALANYTKKGSKIAVKGAINTRNYENKEGNRVYVTEVVADRFNGIEFLDNKQEKQQQTHQAGQPPIDGMDNYGNTGKSDPFGNGSQVDINDDDLPF